MRHFVLPVSSGVGVKCLQLSKIQSVTTEMIKFIQAELLVVCSVF